MEKVKAAQAPSRQLDQFVVRLPAGLREKLKKTAGISQRSMNAEIVTRLMRSMGDLPTHAELETKEEALRWYNVTFPNGEGVTLKALDRLDAAFRAEESCEKDGGNTLSVRVHDEAAIGYDDSGSAFPITEEHRNRFWSEPGMTLRDYFAARMLGHALGDSQIEIAKKCYEMADAMLKVRAAA